MFTIGKKLIRFELSVRYIVENELRYDVHCLWVLCRPYLSNCLNGVGLLSIMVWELCFQSLIIMVFQRWSRKRLNFEVISAIIMLAIMVTFGVYSSYTMSCLLQDVEAPLK